jgi:hypothetical protein
MVAVTNAGSESRFADSAVQNVGVNRGQNKAGLILRSERQTAGETGGLGISLAN